nr:MAG TPA: hypothetical protein [Caudoviricetes sp.]
MYIDISVFVKGKCPKSVPTILKNGRHKTTAAPLAVGKTPLGVSRQLKGWCTSVRCTSQCCY